MKITQHAQIELKKALDSFNQPGSGIHIFNIQGCCGPSIQMDIATHLTLGETAVSLEGIDFYVANDLLTQLVDVTIEFNSTGFRLVGLKKINSGCCG